MSGIDVNALGSEVAAKFVQILTGAGKDVLSYAQAEARKFATSAVEIAALRAKGTITDEEARLHMKIQANASRAVLMAIQGMSKIAVEQAINAALTIVGKAIQTATGVNFLKP